MPQDFIAVCCKWSVEARTLPCLRIQLCFSIIYTLVPVHYSFTKGTYGFISIDSQHCLWGPGEMNSKVHCLATDNSTLSACPCAGGLGWRTYI